jgi:NAD(P)-dependent dehydrogenase (short-subunit alcohol dehydrogenase family)
MADVSKTMVVTGVNTGIGRATAVELCRRGHRVIGVVRDLARGADVLAEMKQASPTGLGELVQMDLSHQASIREGAAKLLELAPRLDVLINNAGVFAQQRQEVDGVELTWAVNVAAPFLLTHLLLDRLKASAPARVVTLSSALHTAGKVNFDDLQMRKGWGRVAYSNTKLAVNLLTLEYARRFAGTGVTFNAVHPGVIASDLARDYPKVAQLFVRAFFGKPEAGAAPSVRLATDPALEKVSGRYFHKLAEKTPSKASLDVDVARKLYDATAALCGV